MKTKLAIVLYLLGLAGCQQTSEIDKCVEAQAISACNSVLGDEPFYKVMGMSEAGCTKDLIKDEGAKWRLECLRAQAGKK
jgi:hypothetical protein